MTITVEALTALGGKLWEQHGKRRVYFNELSRFLGLEANFYNTGNVSSATLNGDKISNSQARRMLWACAGKLWWDASDEKFHWLDINDYYVKQIIGEIEDRLKGASQ